MGRNIETAISWITLSPWNTPNDFNLRYQYVVVYLYKADNNKLQLNMLSYIYFAVSVTQIFYNILQTDLSHITNFLTAHNPLDVRFQNRITVMCAQEDRTASLERSNNPDAIFF